MTSSQYPSRISMPCPFASDNGAALTPIGTSAGNTVNFHDGFPSVYSAPASGGGKYVTRGEMNAIGNLASNDLFYHKAGGLNTFDQAFCTAIGGYPKGAVLQYLVGNQLFEVVSMEENNTTDFTTAGVDGVKWRYCNKDYGNIADEIVLGSYYVDSLNVTANYSNSVIIAKTPVNGLLYVKNLKYTMGYDITYASMGNCFAGIGIIAKSATSQEISQLAQCSSIGADAQGWRAIQIMNYGASPSEDIFGSYINSASGVSIRFKIPTGVPTVTANQYAAVSIINGFESVVKATSLNGNGRSISASFDIVIARI